MGNRGVAQSGRVLGSGPRGRWFESSHSDEKSVEILKMSVSAFFVLVNIIAASPTVSVRHSRFSE